MKWSHGKGGQSLVRMLFYHAIEGFGEIPAIETSMMGGIISIQQSNRCSVCRRYYPKKMVRSAKERGRGGNPNQKIILSIQP